jgi:TPR repeat protein
LGPRIALRYVEQEKCVSPNYAKKLNAETLLRKQFSESATWRGSTFEVDDQKALRLFLLSAAADQGVPRAKTNLARMYAEGVGTAKNLPEAVRLYEKAAEAGEFVAQVELARIYARGVHVPANPEAARKWDAAASPPKTSVGNCEQLEEAMAYVT